MSSGFSSEKLKAEALRLGFFTCGIAEARPVASDVAAHYRQWIARGGHAGMQYLEHHIDMRLDPTLLLPDARSIIVVALNYAPSQSFPEGEYQLAAYAYGKDYHDVLKRRLQQLLQMDMFDGMPSKIATDTVPILERYWAQQAGIGFIGRNHQLVIPHAGSMFFLGEIVTAVPFDVYDKPMANQCGTCRKCIDACPTGALNAGGNVGAGPPSNPSCSFFDSRLCLSYLTIENRNDIDETLKSKLGNTIYGCDRCQQACPWNRFSKPTDIPELQPSEELMTMRRSSWHNLSVDDYRRLFKGSAVKRAKYDGLMRNIRAAEEYGWKSAERQSIEGSTLEPSAQTPDCRE